MKTQHTSENTYLNQMVDHEGTDAGTSPLRMDKEKGDIGFVVFDIRNHESETDHHLTVQNHHTEVWIVEALWYW